MSGAIDDKLAETLLVLIPKENNPTRLKNFRPISLCNVTYKVITKVLVNRIRPFLDELIGPFQSSFIPGRGTTDNAILAQEVIHYMHTSRSKKGTLAFKIDLEKAYDRLDWNFLELTLQEFGFPIATISLIMSCVRASNFSILWNGATTEKFNPSRGLRQGDPLSPYLFVMCMEKLALSIQNKVDMGDWKPVHVSRNGPGLTHLLFADDVLLFCEATSQQIQVVMETLDNFCLASGMKVNLIKSKAMCSKKVPNRVKRQLTAISSIRFVSNLGHYLGFPLVQGRVTKDTYAHILEGMHKRLAAWKGNLLNKAERACLAKSVTTSMPIYTMQLHHLPKQVCDSVDKITKSFIWGGDGRQRKWNIVKWKTVTSPKRHGGLAIRETSISNLALLGKLVWSFVHNTDKLWVRVLSHKYLQNFSIWSPKKSSSSSLIWKGILTAVEALKEGFRYRFGDGESSFWFSNWTGRGPLSHLVDFVNISDTELRIKDVCTNGSWSWGKFMTMIPASVQQLVDSFSAPIIFNPHVHDKWVWSATSNGLYTPSSAYKWLTSRSRSWGTDDWRWVWKLKVPAKLQHFVWLCMHQALPTNQLRHRCNMAESPLCTRCSVGASEDLMHCFRDCFLSVQVWRHFQFMDVQGFQANTFTSWISHLLQGDMSLPFLVILWWLWRWRNNFLLGDRSWRIHHVIHQVNLMHVEIIDHYHSLDPSPCRVEVRWHPPNSGLFKLNVDGSCASDGIGSGGLVRNEFGHWIGGFASKDGIGDTLMSELFAILHGLSLLLQLGISTATCESDCSDAIELILDRDRHMTHAYASLLLKITSLMDMLPGLEIHHVLREANACADYLARYANRHLRGISFWSSPPSGLESLLAVDARFS